MDYDIVQVSPTNAIANWDVISTLLAMASAHSLGEESLEDIRKKVAAQETYVFIVQERVSNNILSVATTQVIPYPQRTSLRVTYLGGLQMAEWKDQLLDCFSQFAALYNCDMIEIVGRRGWVRELRGDGFQEKYVVLTKDLQVRH